MQRVLVVCYSQTGQLRDIVEATIAPLRRAAGIEVVVETLRPARPFPFPWPFWQFFDTFPETVHEVALPNQRLVVGPDEHFDLVILAYQVWFLSPALPTTAFLDSPEARSLLAGRPVITLVGCRNMWLMAQERMKERLAALGARLIDHIALTDKAHSSFTFVSTPLWMLTGKRGPFLGGVVPAAGVPAAEIAACRRFGEAIAAQLPDRDPNDDRPMLQGLGAVSVNERLIASERIGKRSFRLWGSLLRALGAPGTPPRRAALGLYILFLLTLILTVVPISAVLKRLLAPLARGRTAAQRAYFAAPSGEARDLVRSGNTS